MTERASKQQEVQSMAASTSDDINSYVDQISASQEEAQQLMADISNADSNITALVQQAEAEKAAEEKARAEAAAEAERQAAAKAAEEEKAQNTEDASSDSSYEDTDNLLLTAVLKMQEIIMMIMDMIRMRILQNLPAVLQVPMWL